MAKRNILPARIRGFKSQIDNKSYKAEALEDIASDSEESEDESESEESGDNLEEEKEKNIAQCSHQITKKNRNNQRHKRKTLSPPVYIKKLRKHNQQKNYVCTFLSFKYFN